MYECPNCGGALRFDIPTQKLLCDHCNESIDPHAYHKDKDAEEKNEYNVTIFTCPQCGGEILSTDDSATGFCSFCGASTILDSRIRNEKRPAFIIPFKKTKEDCKKSYARMMRRALFAPKELRDPEYLERFRGIYMPYWVYVVDQNEPDGSLSGKKTYRRGNYIITDHYALSYSLNASYRGINYDASSSFDDHISETIAPFDSHEIEVFSPSFLCGFYADTADVPASLYMPAARDLANEETAKALEEEPAFDDLDVMIPVTGAAYGTTVSRKDSAMFPVWFLTYRRRDRVAYAIMNGQTGKISSDLPVDPIRYLIGSLILTVPIFFLLNAILSMTAKSILSLSSLMALITGLIYLWTIRQLRDKDNRVKDVGYQYKNGTKEELRESKMKRFGKKKKRIEKKGVFNLSILLVIFVVCPVAFEILLAIVAFCALYLSSFIFALILCLISLGMGGYALHLHNVYPGQNILAEFSCIVAATVVDLIIAIIHPVSDLFYYAGAMASFACICISIIGLIRKYNLLATRPLPHFNREGGDDRA